MNEPSDDRELRDRLRSLRVDPPDGDFQSSLRQRFLAAGPPAHPSRWRQLAAGPGAPRRMLWPSVGLAAGLALFLALTIARPLWAPSRVTTLPATKVAVVHLNLSADVAVESAQVRVVLPPELSFWADGEELAQHSFEWTQPLRPGNNEIPIAVRGQRPGRYRIVLSARIGDQVVDDEVLLDVVKG